MSSHQYVYVMHRLSKSWPGGKEVLKNISLSFLPGAKIGVLGLNGAGKSTLLRIMAGLDTDFNGEAWAADGIKVGYLAQEPELDDSLDVTGKITSTEVFGGSGNDVVNLRSALTSHLVSRPAIRQIAGRTG